MTDGRIRLAIGLLLLAGLGSSCGKSSSPTSSNPIPGAHFVVVDSLALAAWSSPPVEYGAYLFLQSSSWGSMLVVQRSHPMSILAQSSAMAKPLGVYNGTLYGVAWNSGAQKWELRSCGLSTPTAPQLIGTYSFVTDYSSGTGFLTPKSPSIGYFYGTADSMLQTVDVTNPSAMTLVDSTPGVGRAVTQENGLAVLYMSDSAVILDLTNPAHPVRTGRVLPVGEFRDAAFHGGTLYLNEGWKGVYIFNRTNLTAPVAIIPSTRDSLTEILYRRDTLFLRDGGLLQAYDVSSPAAPEKLAEIDLHGSFSISGSDDLYAVVERGTTFYLLALRLVTK